MTIKVENLNKQFNNILAVKNINFQINSGSIVGLLGPNGCGKTTTIGMMFGLIKPTSGNVFINDKNIDNEKNRTNLLEKMNFISPYVELPKKLTIEENLKVYGRMYGVNNLEKKISNLMEELNLNEFKKRKFIPGKTKIPPTGKVIGDLELQNMVEASLDGWLTAGRFNKSFEAKLAKFIGIKQLITVNSGSSANLIAF